MTDTEEEILKMSRGFPAEPYSNTGNCLTPWRRT